MWNNTTELNNNFSKEDTTMFMDECVIDTKEYYGEFWNKAMKGKNSDYEKLKVGKVSNGMFVFCFTGCKNRFWRILRGRGQPGILRC